ncbi:LLM class F420-dependent oxidoreductase [Streptosporangium violaceochromogenes]|nr:LLM class F420-dependent oxidoreductase [Streptosporangium violaceochromogenes]
MTTYGLVLPHFGRDARRAPLLEAARRAEAAGYDCLWARDHLVYTPHPWEPRSDRFVEQYVALSAAAAVTRRIELGAGVTIPFRPPRHVLTLAESLSALAERRVHIGLGRGDYVSEMELSGVSAERVADRRRETFDLLDAAASRVSGGRPFELWWAGGGRPAVAAAVGRRANWLAGRQTLATFAPLTEELDRLGERAGWRPKVAVWVLADYDAAREVAGGRLPDRALMAAFGRGGGKAGGAPGGDLRGSVLLGGPPEIRADVAALRSLGADHIVFDFRFSGADTWADDVRGFRERILGTPGRPGGGSPGRVRG